MRPLCCLLAIGLLLCVAGGSVHARPTGALSGKIVYLHGGHGWTADNLGSGSWFTQRPETYEIVEDLGNADFHAFQADSLWRAGATVVPLRPIGDQTNEIILDNDDPGVEFVGPWQVSSSPLYFGQVGDTPYLFAGTSPTETAVARYRPLIPESGRYPVYTWVLLSTNRVDQLYRVVHAGGVTEVRVDHRRVGNGLVYLGTYRFDAGDSGYVEISNESAEAGVVIADMIRFGNGMGDIDRGDGPSGEPRADEAALYWIETHAGQGVPSSVWRSSSDDGSASVSAPTRWAAHMNGQGAGSLADRVFLSHHSNAGGGSARGVIALHNGNNNPATATPNQFLLALTLASEINDDMVARNGSFEHDWVDRTTLTLDRSDFEFGEINNLFINDEFDATIVERAFHDNQLDAELLRDTRVNEALARATTQGLVRYFNALDPGTPLAFTPAAVEQIRGETTPDGRTRLTWVAPPDGPALGDPPTGYLVQSSSDGLAFDNGLLVGAGITSVVLPGAWPDPTYHRVVAVSNGGHAPPSPVVACRPTLSDRRLLVVNGFDRSDRFLNVRESYGAGLIDRVRPHRQNARDYIRNAAPHIALHDGAIAIDSAQNEDVSDASVLLADYDGVVWLLGEESSIDQTLDATERALIQAFLDDGGSLLISGAEIGWDLDFLGSAPDYFNDVLLSDFASDDAGTYNAIGVFGTLFEGVDLSFDDGDVEYDAQFPDVLAPVNGSSPAMLYNGGLGGVAAIQRPPFGALGALVVMGFPFETILDPLDRDGLMSGFLSLAGIEPCQGDLTTTGGALDGVPDGTVDLSDLLFFVNAWDADLGSPTPNPGSIADVTTTGGGDPGVPDGNVDLSDLLYYVNDWQSGLAQCP